MWNYWLTKGKGKDHFLKIQVPVLDAVTMLFQAVCAVSRAEEQFIFLKKSYVSKVEIYFSACFLGWNKFFLACRTQHKIIAAMEQKSIGFLRKDSTC